jgi:hypothetical protein
MPDETIDGMLFPVDAEAAFDEADLVDAYGRAVREGVKGFARPGHDA